MAHNLPDRDRERIRLLPLLMFQAQGNRMLAGDELASFIEQYKKHHDSSETASIQSIFDEAHEQRGLGSQNLLKTYSDHAR